MSNVPDNVLQANGIETHFGDYAPETFGWVKTGNFLRYAYDGVPFGAGLNPAAGLRTVVTAILAELVPQIPGGLISGECWGGDWTDPTADSFHEYGVAFDINAPENPKWSGQQPWGSTGVVPEAAGPIARKYGFEWGGNFSPDNPPDYMHFECHLSPDGVQQLAQIINGTPTAAPPPVPVVKSPTDEYPVNENQLSHDLPPLTDAEYLAGHTGKLETPAERANIENHVPKHASSTFPLPAGDYFGAESGPAQSISGMSTSEGTAIGAHRAEIAQVQAALNKHTAGVTGAPAELIIDGQYGPHTIGCVQWFQTTHGLHVDGNTGPATWAALGL